MMHVSARRCPTVAVLGEFDGVHVGHQHLLGQSVAFAGRSGLDCSAIILDHPRSGRSLSTVAERCERLLRGGADGVFALEVPDLEQSGVAATIVAEVLDLLVLDTVVMACRLDTEVNRFPALRPALDRAGVPVIEIQRTFDATYGMISCGVVRDALSCGSVDDVCRMLGRPYSLSGVVTIGDQRGRTLGFPTANVHPAPERLVPPAGVYACWALVGTDRWPAAVNIGVRPTFYERAGAQLIEAHLIGFDGDLYGRSIEVRFIRRLRDERRFDGIESLKHQLIDDVAQTRRSLAVIRD
jgi:riboflavin kinase/FMN adenylyltransferase